MCIWFWLACANPDKSQDNSFDTVNGSQTDDSAVQDENNRQRFLVTTSILIQRSGHIRIVDRDTQEEVWFLENTDAPAWPEARLSPDGLSIWHNVVDAVSNNPTESKLIQRHSSGQILHQIQIDAAHHSFDFVDDNTLVTLVTDIRQHPVHGAVAGDVLTLVTHSAETAALLSTFDVLEPQPLTDMWFGGNLENAIDWTHSNAVGWYPEHDRFLMCIPGINAIWLIDSAGHLQTVLLGDGMTAEPYRNGPMGPTLPFEVFEGGSFSLPHGATLDSQGRLWVLSNGLGNQTPSYAEGYDWSSGTLERIMHLGTDPQGAHSPGLGSVLYIEAEDRVVINWGIWGVVEERTVSGTPIWRSDAPLGEVYGFTTAASGINEFLNAD
ncbi:MAG: aryl-sulfate sulfotransferase [Myxococcota bacterium]|nr:aryl-sulfate sulfotransferase [Myxococcota bacterium]MEC8381916.1 aryl-sulfate sulfotransferase [Myxococcota bacterium]